MHGDIIKFKINTINEAGGAAVAEKSVAENKSQGNKRRETTKPKAASAAGPVT